MEVKKITYGGIRINLNTRNVYIFAGNNVKNNNNSTIKQ